MARETKKINKIKPAVKNNKTGGRLSASELRLLPRLIKWETVPEIVSSFLSSTFPSIIPFYQLRKQRIKEIYL